MATIVAVVIAVAGWLVSHWLALRAQRARMEIAKAIHRYDDWLDRAAHFVELTLTIPRNESDQQRAHIASAIISEAALQEPTDPRLEWHTLLEEYELLFPETRQLRRQLKLQQLHLNGVLHHCREELRKLGGAPSADRDALTKELSAYAISQHAFVKNQQSLMRELRLHLQRVSLGRVFGNGRQIPQPEYHDPNTETIAVGPDGQLVISRLANTLPPASTVVRD